MAGGVFALDLATTTGWAIGRLPIRPLTPMEATVLKPPQPLSGVRRFGRPGCAVGSFADDAERWMVGMIAEHRPAGIIFEKPVLPTKTNPETVMRLNGLAVLLQMAAHRAGIAWTRTAQPSTIKKHFCGFGGPGKESVMAACLARGWSFTDDNEADALALWDFAATIAAREGLAA